MAAFYKWFLNFQTLSLEGPGLYYFELHLREEGVSKWKRVATTPLLIEYNVDEDAPMMQNVPPPDDDEEAEP